MTTDLEQPKVDDPILDDGDHDRFSHIVRKDEAARGYIDGASIEALCGKKWVPSKNPDNYPVCPDCEKVLKRILSAQQGNN